MPFKSYIEPKDLPTDGFRDLSSALSVIKYGDIGHDEKPDVIVVKESFFLRDSKGKKVGVFTRSSKDHSATLGDCRVLLNNDFMREEASVDNFGRVSYDVSDRLHEQLGKYSALFRPANAGKSILVHYKNETNNRRYIFAIFEMICVDFPPPFYIKLKTRMEDAFVGLHALKDVASGIKKYNKSTTEIDENLINLVRPKRIFQNQSASIFSADIKNSAVSANVTLLKVNLVGIG